MTALLTFPGAVERDPSIGRWLEAQPGELTPMARRWFAVMRRCGPTVREFMHHGCPTVCVQDAPFAYVNAFNGHVNVGFFHGAALTDPAGLLAGTGKPMRHVTLTPGLGIEVSALEALINTAYRDIVARLGVDG